jgi:hypothetical protein
MDKLLNELLPSQQRTCEYPRPGADVGSTLSWRGYAHAVDLHPGSFALHRSFVFAEASVAVLCYCQSIRLTCCRISGMVLGPIRRGICAIRRQFS